MQLKDLLYGVAIKSLVGKPNVEEPLLMATITSKKPLKQAQT